jgi:low affinity Fe/Cu permease
MFEKIARSTSRIIGSPWTFLTAFLLILGWAIGGFLFGFSNTWQLLINTGTTIITFLMVFLIQNTQNRDAKALHLKLDELLRAIHEARTGLVDIENLSDKELSELEREFQEIRQQSRA